MPAARRRKFYRITLVIAQALSSGSSGFCLKQPLGVARDNGPPRIDRRITAMARFAGIGWPVANPVRWLLAPAGSLILLAGIVAWIASLSRKSQVSRASGSSRRRVCVWCGSR